MKNIFTKNKIFLKKFFSNLALVLIFTSFVFANPDQTFKNSLIRNQIKVINESNAIHLANVNVVYAQGTSEPCSAGDPGCTPMCCDGFPAHTGSYCDDANQCTKTKICCPAGTNPGPTEECDNTMPQCAEDPKNYVCCDGFASNAFEGPLGPNDECKDSVCTYDYIYYCCDSTMSNYTAPEDMDPIYGVCGGSCVPFTKVCCDTNWDNYKNPSDRSPNDQCDYEDPTCACNANPPHRSQCGGTTPPTTGTSTPGTCLLSTNFSTLKSGVSIGGGAQMTTSAVVCDPLVDLDCDPIKLTKCNSAIDTATLAGMAAAAASPDTPLNVPQELNAFATYTVTSKDWCQNIEGSQDSTGYNRDNDGFCCVEPATIENNDGVKSCLTEPTASCGTATLSSSDNPPSSDLCTVGTPGTISQTTTTFNWDCTLGASIASCSSGRTCNGTTCVEQDYCLNISGIQDINYASANNMYIDSDSNCWNNVTGACGSAIQVPAPTGGPTNNLCLPYSSVDTSPTLNTTINPNKWQWTCKNASGSRITPPAFCEATPCVGAQCTPTTSSLIKTFRARPSIVSDASSFCSLTWESEIDDNTDADVPVVCTLNGNSTYNGNTIYDDNLTGLSVPPGSYAFSCTDSENNTQTKSLKCVTKPDFKEI